MPNGNGLAGNYSSTQSSLIVPMPQSETLFYVFTTDAGNMTTAYNDLFCYSVVDMCLNTPWGDVVTSTKNTVLYDSTTEKIAACLHADSQSYWVVAHTRKSLEYCAFLLQSTGITDTVVSAVSLSAADYWQGQMKFSPSGNKIAVAFAQQVEVADFDIATGIVSNPFLIDLPNPGTSYGVEFSPDGTKLYCSYCSYAPVAMYVSQFDLTAGGGHPDSVANSIYVLNQLNGGAAGRGLQIGPDNKIYGYNLHSLYAIDVIDAPDLPGSACNYMDSICILTNMGNYTLPSFVAGYHYATTKPDCSKPTNSHEIVMPDQQTAVFPNPFDNNAIMHFPSEAKGPFQVTVFDASGKYACSFTTAENELRINHTQFQKGMYFYSVKNNGIFIQSGKFIAL
jgi:hypothetical protein